MHATKFAVWLLAGLLVMAACDDDGGPVPVASVANVETYGLLPDIQDEQAKALALKAFSMMYGMTVLRPSFPPDSWITTKDPLRHTIERP